MINVLLVNDNLRLPAGITMVIKNIIDNTDCPDIVFSILTIESERNNALEHFQNKGVEIYYMPIETSTSSNNKLKKIVSKLNVFSLFSLRSFLVDFFKNKHFDVIHSHFAQIDNIMFPIAKKNGVKCCISHSHSSKLSDSFFRALRNKIMCHGLVDLADYCAACSESAGIALFGNRFIHSPKRVIINNGIHLDLFAYNEQGRNHIRRKYGISDDTFLIGNVGRLNKVKNQSFLIDILAEIITKDCKYKLMLVGNGECEDELRQKVDKMNLSESVFFTGAQSEISPFLSAFDIFVMPSLHEGLGISAIEAQANGLECILSSSIPNEVDLTGVKFLDIVDNRSEWVKSIMLSSKKHHLNFKQMVFDGGYDIRSVCDKLTVLYKEKVENE